jgi:dipeptidyl aminopeptidase/acylaminoacyl peptidase
MRNDRARFEALGRTHAPDLWRDIEGREPRQMPPPPLAPRVLAGFMALLVAAVGVGAGVLVLGPLRDSGDNAAADRPGVMAFSAYSEGHWQIFSVAPSGGTPSQLTDLLTDQGQPAWSPDGSMIAFSVQHENGRMDVAVMNSDGSGVRLLTTGPGWNYQPDWSPDGSRIAFVSNRSGNDEIYVMNADGSNQVRLTDDRDEDLAPAWSPDGARIAFESNRDGNNEIYAMNVDGSDIVDLTDAPESGEFDPAWSPDGRKLAFASDRDGGPEIYVMTSDASSVTRLTTDAAHDWNPAWSPDGSQIAFESDRDGPVSLYVMEADGAGVHQISGLPFVEAFSPTWQRTRAATGTVEPSPTIAPSAATVVDTFKVGEDVRSVVYAEGSVWVAASNNDGNFGGRILRIDPTTHEVQAEIPVDAIPTWEVGGGAMVFADGDLWVAGDIEEPGAFNDPGGGADAAVVRIDTATNEVVRTFELGGTSAADLLFLDGELWVLVSGDETVDHRMEVVRVDPATVDDLTRIPLETGWGHTVVAADGRLVVLESGPGATNAAGHAAVIDPQTNTVSRAKVPSEYMTPMPVVSRGQVWIALDPGFARFDPQAVAFADPVVTLPATFSDCCGFVEADDRGVWFLNLAANGTDHGLSLFDPDTQAARELAVLGEGTPVAMAVAPDSIWVLNYEGTLTHVELG